MNAGHVTVRATCAKQGDSTVFSFFLPARRLVEIAEISRIERTDDGSLEGFQRPEIRSHIRGIVNYLDRGDILFPNAIVLALAPGAVFKSARGSKPTGREICSDAGTLVIPIHRGRKAGWVVDGQQRTLALAETVNQDLPVPVIAFISADLAVHREQFILVNKAKPLSPRLIDVLLPEVECPLPADLVPRKVPSALCDALNSDPKSPFYRLIKRPGHAASTAVITDSCLVRLIRRSIKDPFGVLLSHVHRDGSADIDAMYATLLTFWAAVRDAFPEAWGLPPSRSRLMHSAGIDAMGYLMDRIMTRAMQRADAKTYIETTLSRIAPHCRWTGGVWEDLNLAWNDLECTPRSVKRLRDLLISLEIDAGRLAA